MKNRMNPKTYKPVLPGVVAEYLKKKEEATANEIDALILKAVATVMHEFHKAHKDTFSRGTPFHVQDLTETELQTLQTLCDRYFSQNAT